MKLERALLPNSKITHQLLIIWILFSIFIISQSNKKRNIFIVYLYIAYLSSTRYFCSKSIQNAGISISPHPWNDKGSALNLCKCESDFVHSKKCSVSNSKTSGRGYTQTYGASPLNHCSAAVIDNNDFTFVFEFSVTLQGTKLWFSKNRRKVRDCSLLK